MIPAPFTYQRATSVDEALSLAAQGGDDAKYLAGGHSLLPLMKLRLAVPEVLIDIGRLSELSYVREQDGHIAVGALTSHHDVTNSSLLGSELPLLAHAAGQVGDPQIRHRGTIGGSLVHSDPAGDLPAVILVLDATLVARGPAGTREIPAGEFFEGLFETALAPGELLTEIRIVIRPGCGSAYEKVLRRVGDWPIGAAAAAVRLSGDRIAEAGIGLAAVGARNFAAAEAEAMLRGAPATEATLARAGEIAAEHCRPSSDQRGPADYKRHLASELTVRALRRAVRRARGEDA